MVIQKLGENCDEETTLVLIMGIDAHATLKIQGIVFHIFSAVCLIIKEGVGIIEHGLLYYLTLPVRHILEALVPGRSMMLALTSVVYLPACQTWTVL